MSKAVRWQVPFVSVSGTHYRVDIYDEGYTGNAVQLLAGDQPFVTDEDASDDYFAPVRSQSGTLQVCTKIPSGGMLSLNDILPSNNIARPVRLINTDNSNTIEWQGFLSCEVYNQDYVGIPQNLSLSLISVLEAMDSVHITTTNFTGAKKGNILLYYTLKKIETDCGLTCFTHLAYSYASWRILQKYFDPDLFFETKEQINGFTTNYILEGMSCKELLNRICTFMGWVCREQGTTVYFQRIGEEVGLYKQTLSSLQYPQWTSSQARTLLELQSANLSGSDWLGTGHQKSALQGAKSVEVVANIEDFDADMALPDFPGSNPTSSYIKQVDDYNGGNPRNLYIENIVEQDQFANNITTYAYYYGRIFESGDNAFTAEYLGTSTQADFLAHAFLRTNRALVTYSSDTENYKHYAGAAYIRYAVKSSQSATPDSYDQGLYCVFLPGLFAELSTLDPIFKLRNPNPVSLYRGTLHIKMSMLFFAQVATSGLSGGWLDHYAYLTSISGSPANIEPIACVYIKVGSWYRTNYGWTTSRLPYTTKFSGDGIDIEIPITDNIYGEMEIGLLAGIGDNTPSRNMSVLFETIIKSIDVSFKPANTIQQLDKSENHYFQLLSTNFRDEISIGTDLATDNNNIASPSLIMDDYTATDDSRYTKHIDYGTSTSTTEARRPEVDLLNRLAAYYGAARHRLELEVAHPTVAPLPLLNLNGINDGKVYLPLSESRDWQTGVCKLTCFETPTT